jgi:hypothetical protein
VQNLAKEISYYVQMHFDHHILPSGNFKTWMDHILSQKKMLN